MHVILQTHTHLLQGEGLLLVGGQRVGERVGGAVQLQKGVLARVRGRQLAQRGKRGPGQRRVLAGAQQAEQAGQALLLPNDVAQLVVGSQLRMRREKSNST